MGATPDFQPPHLRNHRRLEIRMSCQFAYAYLVSVLKQEKGKEGIAVVVGAAAAVSSPTRLSERRRLERPVEAFYQT